jgi:hypothetical protein
MFYSYLYFCTARKVAVERGFDRFGVLSRGGADAKWDGLLLETW